MKLGLVWFVSAATAVGCSSFGQTLLGDWNSTPTGEVASSSPWDLTNRTGGEVLFTMETPESGRELWKSDGTLAGTALVAELVPGYQGGDYRQLRALPNGEMLFTVVTDAFGWELWKSDGTEAGTSLVKDVAPGPASSVVDQLTVVGSEAYFFANDGVHGIELWVSDGTEAGTRLVKDIVPGPGGMSNGTSAMAEVANGQIVFSALIGGGLELWVSDGTEAGTTQLAQFGGLSFFGLAYMTSIGDYAFFNARDQNNVESRWVSDGTVAGTFSLGVGGAGRALAVNGLAYFQGDDPTFGREPWVTDGTLAGTQLVKDVAVGPLWTSSNPTFLGSVGSLAVFRASPTLFSGELWVTDGTDAGTVSISTDAGLTSVGPPGGIGGELFLYSLADGFEGLWKTDGTAGGTTFVHPVIPRYMTEVGGTILFHGQEDATGSELWTTDGTTAGTQILADLSAMNPTFGSVPVPAGRHNDLAFYTMDATGLGRELFVTDGTPGGTGVLMDFEPGPGGSSTSPVASTGTFCMFTVINTTTSPDPWISDGTTAGTTQLPMSSVYPGFEMHAPAAWNDRVVFPATEGTDGFEPWISDGTVAGTERIVDLNPGPGASSSPRSFFPFDDLLLFTAETPGGGREPHVTDGTAAGTMLLAETGPGTLGTTTPNWFRFGEHVYFINSGFQSEDVELWRTDGTPTGTILFADLNPGPESSFPGGFVDLGERLLFSAMQGNTRRLFVTDGTTTDLLDTIAGWAGTVLAIDASTALVLDGTINSDRQIWVTDGTPAGTTFLGLWPFEGDAIRDAFHLTDDRLLLTLEEPVDGQELWVTGGLGGTTRQLFDVGPGDSRPDDLVRIGDTVVFSADNGVDGRELFSFPLTLMGDEAIELRGFANSGGGDLPTLAIDGEPDAGATTSFDLVATGSGPGGIVFLTWSQALAPVPLPGGILWPGPAARIETLVADATGEARLTVPPGIALAGTRFVSQAFPLVAGGPILGLLSSSAALELVVGP